MTLRESVLRESGLLLEQAAADLRRSFTTATSRTATLMHRGGVQVSLSVLSAPDANSLDLCVMVRDQDGEVTIEADLSEGETGRIFGEWPLRRCGEAGEEIRELAQFIRTQTNVIASAIREAAGRGSQDPQRPVNRPGGGADGDDAAEPPENQ